MNSSIFFCGDRETRTLTPRGTRSLVWSVYQFQHIPNKKKDPVCTAHRKSTLKLLYTIVMTLLSSAYITLRALVGGLLRVNNYMQRISS